MLLSLPTKAQSDIMSSLEKAIQPDTVPISKGGVSRTFASAQSMHDPPKPVKVKVTEKKNDKGDVTS